MSLEYSKVSESMYDEDIESPRSEGVPFLRSDVVKYRSFIWGRWTRVSHVFWIFTTFLFGFIALGLYIEKQYETVRRYGLPSELMAARSSIEYHDIVFTSGIEEDENGKMFLSLPAGEPHYVGSPSPAIDAAWKDLTKATEIWVDGDEATPVFNKTISSEKGWLVSLDAYHSLHCVNLARKGFDFDYYYGDGPDQEPVNYITRDHIYHCLEHLRQVAMCHGDLTPMRFKWMEHGKGGIPIWTEPHSCRKWDNIKTWAEERMRDGKTLTHDHEHHHDKQAMMRRF